MAVHKSLTSSFLLILWILICTNTEAASKSRTIHILSLLPSSPDSPSQSDGPAISLALDMAKKQINSQIEILPDYRIELVHEDSVCNNSAKAYQAILRTYYNEQTVIGVIGPGCSSSTLALLSRKEISLVTLHGGGSPALSNRIKFPYALGSLGSNEGFTRFAVKLMQKSNWSRIGVLFDESDTSNLMTINTLLKEVITLSNEGFFSSVSETYLPLSDITRTYLRVIFLFTPVAITQRVLCLAQHQGMVYDEYQWIVVGNTFDEVAQDITFSYDHKEYNCSKETMKTITLNGVYFLEFKISSLNESTASTYSRYSFAKYDQRLRDRIENYNSQKSMAFNISYSFRTTYFYDSLWAWAVVLDRLTKKHSSLDLTGQKYGNTTLSDMIVDEFYSLDFSGVSGRIKFNNSTGFLTRMISLFQVIDEMPMLVSHYDGESFMQVRPFISIPDRFEDKVSTVNDGIIPVFLIFATMELIAVVFLHVMTIKYRSHPSVKASSVLLSQLIYLGCYLYLLNLFFNLIHSHSQIDGPSTEILQNLITPWLHPISITLIIGTVGARTFRLYRIFLHYLKPGRFIANKYLFTFVLFLVLIDVILGILWTAIDPLKLHVIYLKNEGNAGRIVVRRWRSTHEAVWNALMFIYKILIYLSVVRLTFLTRSIRNQSFSTKALRTFSYLAGAVSTIGIAMRFLNQFKFANNEDAHVRISTFILLSLLILLVILLIGLPPLVPIFRDLFHKYLPTQRFRLCERAARS